MEKRLEFHGSDLEKIAEYYGIAQEEIIKFGANVNPLGLSQSVKKSLAAHLDVISSYPDRNYKTLKECISTYCSVPASHVVVGNGSTELISLLISQRRAKKALILGPAYSEYARELSLTGGEIYEYNLKESENFELDMPDFLHFITSGTDLIILCNPNNPTSSAIRLRELELLLSEAKKRDIFVMIDETYVEFSPNVSEITAVSLTGKYDNLIVIRGVSNFFAAPGLRFGYGITSNTEFLKALLMHQNPWSLNSIGAYAGELMLRDTEYIEQTRALVCTERDMLYERLKKISKVKVYKPYGNFILVRILKPGITSFDVFEAAIKEKMMIRDCSSFKTLNGEYIRFCIMMPSDNERLMKCIERTLGTG